MVSVNELVELNPDVFYITPVEYSTWAEVNNQATRHTQRSDFTDLYDISRPLEDDIYKQWRENNKRHVTASKVDRFITSVQRVLKYSSVTMDDIKGLDDDFSEVLSENPFLINGVRVSFDKLRYECNIQAAIEDPNAILVEVPYDPEKPLEPLFENFDLTKRPQVDTFYIPFHHIQYAPNDKANVFMWFVYQKELEYTVEEEVYTKLASVFMAVDEEAYYWCVPRLSQNEHEEYEIVYDLELHYTHGLGRLPIARLPRRMKTRTLYHGGMFDRGESFKYGESFIGGAFPYFDEAVVRLSMDQVNFVRHIYPKFWMRGSADCPECKGAKRIKVRKAGFGSPMEEMACPSCNGTGDMPADTGQFSTYRIPDSSHPSDKQSPGVPMGYVGPPTEVLQMGDKSWQDWLQMGSDALMLDPVDGTANESGEAKKMRLLAKEDMIKDFGDMEIQTIEDILNNKYDLLFPDNDHQITIPRPLTYNVKNSDTLREEYDNAPQALKHKKFLMWKKAEFRDDQLKVKAFELASLYAPLIHYDDNEVSQALGTTYNPIDVIRRDYAHIIFEHLLADLDIDEVTNIDLKEWRERADQWLVDNGIVSIQETGIADDDLSDLDDLEDEPISDPAPTSIDQNAEQQIRDIVTAMVGGALSREEAIAQIAQISGEPEEEIDRLLTAQNL